MPRLNITQHVISYRFLDILPVLVRKFQDESAKYLAELEKKQSGKNNEQ